MKKITLGILSILVVMVFLEFALRIPGRKNFGNENHCRRLDKFLHHRLIANAQNCVFVSSEMQVKYSVNSLGLKDYEFPLRKPNGVLRILMLGDSFAEGFGQDIEKTFSKILERKLNEDGTSKKFEVINAGVFGYSPLLEYFYLKKEGLKLEPDLVILNFDTTDIHDDYKFEQDILGANPGKTFDELLESGQPLFDFEKIIVFENQKVRPFVALPFLSFSFKNFLKQHLKSYTLIAETVKAYKENKEGSKKFADPYQDPQFAARFLAEGKLEAVWEYPKRNLIRIKKMLAGNNISLVINAYPNGQQASSKEWNVGRSYWGFEKGKTYSVRHFELLEKLGKEDDIPIFNLLPDFQNAPKFPLYYPTDGHLNQDGHEFMANLLYEKLMRYLKK